MISKRQWLMYLRMGSMLATAVFVILTFQNEQMPNSPGGAGPYFYATVVSMVVWVIAVVAYAFAKRGKPPEE